MSTADHLAIVGMAGRFPAAADLTEFWHNIRDGVESITHSTPEELLAAGLSPELVRHPDFVPAHGNLADSAGFDADFFGYSAREAELLDPQQRLFLECAYHAVEDAGLCPSPSDRVAVYAGSGLNTYVLQNVLTRPDLVDMLGAHHVLLSNDKDYLATRVAYKLGLTGPALTVQTACSTSLVAVHMACQSLLTYQCDAALAGGSRVSSPRRNGYLFQEGGIGSPDGHCRAYDAAAAGTVGGDGVGVVVLKRLADALADRDTIHAVILGSASNNDGTRKVGFTAPSVSGQAAVIAEALAMAEVDASTISYVEGHGTATPLGDPVEVAALTQAYRRTTDRRAYCALGSVKTNIGHLDAAAGIAGLLKTVLMLKHRQLPPSLHFDEPNPEIDFAAGPFYVGTRLTPWRRDGAPRRAGVSSFGIGGTNAHVVMEEAPDAAPAPPAAGPDLIVLSARTSAALVTASADVAGHLRRRPEVDLADAAHTLRAGRQTHPWRRFVVCADREQALAALESADRTAAEAVRRETRNPPVYFMFPGGGTEYVQMGRGLYDTYPRFRDTLDECADLLRPHLGADLRAVLYTDGGEPALARGAVNLPAIFAVEYALSRLLMSWGIRPRAMIGHSLGEYTAACLSGVLSLGDCLRLVALRGQLFDTLPPGAMLAVTAPADELAPLPDGLSIAAVNAPRSCVVSGPVESVDEYEKRLTDAGTVTVRLRAPGAAHSVLIDQVMARYEDAVAGTELGEPQLPYISNVTGSWASAAEVGDPRYWSGQLRRTVRFADGIAALNESGPGVFVEVGPGHGLSTLVRQQSEGSEAITTMPRVLDGESDVHGLLGALGQLWSAGVPVDWPAVPADRRRMVTLPGYPFERREYWLEPGAEAVSRRPRGGDRRADMARWFDTPAWRPAPALSRAAPRPAGEHWVIFTDGGPLGRRLSDRLAGEGAVVTEVTAGPGFARPAERRYTVGPGDAESHRRLVGALADQDLLPDQVALLWPLSGSSDESVAAFERAQSTGFYPLLFLAQALEHGNVDRPVCVHVVGAGLHRVTGSERLDPQAAPVLGACRVLPQEYGHLTCHVVDLEAAPATGAAAELAAEQLLAGCADAGEHPVKAYRAGRRWVPGFEPVAVPEPAADPFRPQGSYLITGGADEYMEPFASRLTREYGARITILERRSFPAPSEWDAWLDSRPETDPTSERIRRIRELPDGRVNVITADVAVPGELARAVRDAGALHGVFHTAGLAEERLHHLARDTTMAVCQEHFRRRAHSTIALAAAVRGLPLDFCLVRSNLSAQLGGIGRVAAVAAAAFTHLYAERHGARWFTTDWDDGQFTPASDRSTSLGPPFTGDEIMRATGRIIALPEPVHLVVLADDLQARVDYWQRHGSGQEIGDGQATHPRPALPSAYVAPRNEIEERVAHIWQQLLGIDPVGVDDDYFHLGGHSMLGAQLISRLRTTFGVDLPLRDLFEAPTVAGMAERVLLAQATQIDSEGLDALLDELTGEER